jgi:hypothetical protein
VRLTTDLATTGAQIVPVLAIGAVIAYRARARAHDQMIQPLSTGVKRFSRRVVELHEQGLRGQKLLDAVTSEQDGTGERAFGTTYVLRLLAVVAVLVTILANLFAAVVCLLVLSEAVTGRGWQAVVVICAIGAGLLLLVGVPLLAAGPMWALPFTVVRTPEYTRARAIIEEAAAHIRDGR